MAELSSDIAVTSPTGTLRVTQFAPTDGDGLGEADAVGLVDGTTLTVGVAAIVSVYATGAVPGQFVPGAEAAFLTSAVFSLAAFVVATTGLRTRRTPAPATEELEPELVEAA